MMQSETPSQSTAASQAGATDFVVTGAHGQVQLTARQWEVLNFICETIDSSGFPPTLREIGNALEIRSTNGVNDHLKALERKGCISRSSAKSRAMMVLTGCPPNAVTPETSVASEAPAIEQAQATRSAAANRNTQEAPLEIPLLGRIAAGVPIEAVEAAERHLQLDPTLLRVPSGSGVFALRVEGDSMIGDGIFDGDLVFVRRQETWSRGEVMAVMVDGSATVKRVDRSGSTIRLLPSNPDMEPIVVDESEARDVSVIGKVVGVYRQL